MNLSGASMPSTTYDALADPTRRAILDLLREQGPQRAGDIAAHFPHISRPAVSKHLRVLREAALVQETHEGRERWYHLTPEPLGEVYAWLQHYEALWRTRLDILKALAENDPDNTVGGIS